MKPQAVDIASVVLACCAVVLTGVVVEREFLATAETAPRFRSIEQAPSLMQGGRAVGAATAPVTIVEFADFQCRYCARAEGLVSAILSAHAGQVRVLFRHFPLESIHPHARVAAVAAECAGSQDRFEEYRKLLFEHQDSIGVITWHEFARRAEVPRVHEFDHCVLDERFASTIAGDVQEGQRLGIRGTPAFVIGDELVEGIPATPDFERRIARALKRGGRRSGRRSRRAERPRGGS